MKDKSKKSTYSTTFGVDPKISLIVKGSGMSEIIHLLALSRVSDLHTIKKPILKIGPF